MSATESLTVTLPAEVAARVKDVVAAGEYDSPSDVVAAALRDWTRTRAAQADDMVSLKADIAEGLADIDAGRVSDFDVDRIIALGRRLLADRSPSV
jgi:antitoxin ParD1/3/4